MIQFVLASGIDIRSRTSNTSTGAMQDISNAPLISAKKNVVNVYNITLVNPHFTYEWQT